MSKDFISDYGGSESPAEFKGSVHQTPDSFACEVVNDPLIRGPKRLYSLDVLRGVGAISVVLFHWIHFFHFPGSIEYDINSLPATSLLAPIYSYGYLAVDFFFCLSGFIFFLLYSQSVEEHRITFWQFSVRRFARLYPLHVVTLITVLAMQRWMGNNYGYNFVYPENNLYHLILHLFFANAWGMEVGYSFNGPAWSVSVEVLLYGVFFVVCRCIGVRFWFLLLIATFGGLVLQGWHQPLGRGVTSFFLGGCSFLCFNYIRLGGWRKRRRRREFYVASAGVVFLLCVFSIASIPQHVFHHQTLVSEIQTRISNLWITGLLFPSVIVIAAALDPCLARVCKPLAWLGDISYSMYMWHFPIQLVFAASVARWFKDTSIFNSALFMAAFFACLISVSLASYRYIETPMQSAMRRLG